MTHDQLERTAADAATALGAITSPLWLSVVEHGYQFTMAAGGFALLVLRLAIAWREFQEKRKAKREG